jgi:acetyl-CoA acetyltransferase
LPARKRVAWSRRFRRRHNIAFLTGSSHEGRCRYRLLLHRNRQAGRGALNQTHGIPMAAHVLRNVVARAGIEAAEVEDVVLGCGLPEGATGHNIARNAALEAGFGIAVPGVTINRYCGSGLTAASIAAVAPEEMSIAITPAIRRLMKYHQLAMTDIDLWELHEAYAVTTLYNQASSKRPGKSPMSLAVRLRSGTLMACRASVIAARPFSNSVGATPIAR